jgi:hypothetical protein
MSGGAGEIEAMQESIQHWLELDEGDPILVSCLFIVFKLGLKSEIFYLFVSALTML